METCDRIVILSFLDFRVQPLATTNSGAQKFEQSVHISSLLLEFGEVESNQIHGCFASSGGEAYTSEQGSYLGKLG